MTDSASLPRSQPKPIILTPGYAIPDILAERTINLWAGPSGAGKTTCLLQAIHSWDLCEPFLDFQPLYALPYFYIALDRTTGSILLTYKRMNLPVQREKIFSFVDNGGVLNWGAIISIVPKGTKLLIIEGGARLVTGKGVGDYNAVAECMSEGQRIAQQYNLIIILTHHSPKAKENEKYLTARERIMGSAAFGAYTETNFVLEPTGERDQRILYVLPRNAKEREVYLEFADGHIIAAPKLSTPAQIETWNWLKAQKMEIWEFVNLRQGVSCCERTCRNVLNDWLEGGQVERLDHGTYRATGRTN